MSAELLAEALGWAAAAPDAAWRARHYDVRSADDAAALLLLVQSGAAAFVHDTIAAQLAELVETRHPARKLAPDETAREVAALAGARPLVEYGTWVFQPWSRRLVHVLPREQYRELRTSRNRNKITLDEQRRLGALTVGVAGLSVGQATAITLALEGVGGRFRLADFDTLALSNMNRLRAGAHAIGVNKAVLTAREIFEIDPYADVTVFERGVRDDTLDAFLNGLDLLFEECDDLKMKVRLRERARELGIPVLMETSDRGLFDVERFDREPARPIFHGLVGGLRAAELDGLSTYEKVPVVLGILGAETISPRLAASLVDVEATLKTWPQLASAVALGAAVNTDAARRVALGELRESGRFFVDLAQLVADGAQAQLAVAAVSEPPGVNEPLGANEPTLLAPLAPLVRTREPLAPRDVSALVARAALAPSGGNCQPWRFVARGARIACLHDVARSRSFLDFAHGAAYAALGAAVENLALAARTAGWEPTVAPFPDAGDATRVCVVQLEPGAPEPSDGDAALARAIEARVTNRRLGARVALDAGDAGALRDEAARAGAELELCTDPDALDELGRVLGRGDRFRFLSPPLHAEMMRELRWTPAEALRTRDGLDVATLELPAADLAGVRLLRGRPILDELTRIGGGDGLEKSARKSVAAASALGLLTVAGTGADSYFRGGRALERVWLAATARGLALQPMTALVYLFARAARGAAADFAPAERAELDALRARFARVFHVASDRAEVILFRIGRAAPPSARSLRRTLNDILTFDETVNIETSKF
jgi:nitroreductase